MYGFTLFRTSLTCALRHSLVPTDLITLANLALYSGSSMTSLEKKGRMAKINRKFFFDHCRQVLFTGCKFSDFFNPTTEDWKRARKIINGLDCAEIIEMYSCKFYSAISYTTV